MPISNQQLKDAFLTPQMKCYFQKKLPEICPVDLDIRIEETLKFLNIATYCHGSIPVSREIDEIWHFWILETQEYQRLCHALQGRNFIHHSSNAFLNCSGEIVPPIEDELEQQTAMLGTYVLNYGPFDADRVRYWKLASHLVDNVGWSIEYLNDRLIAATTVSDRPVPR
jgi:hypothetical protein